MTESSITHDDHCPGPHDAQGRDFFVERPVTPEEERNKRRNDRRRALKMERAEAEAESLRRIAATHGLHVDESPAN